jgi:hypothetical protein
MAADRQVHRPMWLAKGRAIKMCRFEFVEIVGISRGDPAWVSKLVNGASSHSLIG